MANPSPPEPSTQNQAPSPILSNSPSLASESFSASARAAKYPSYLLAAYPQPEFVSPPHATRIASLVEASPNVSVPVQKDTDDDDDDAHDVERSMTVVSVGAVGIINSFLDKLLFDILHSARATNITALRQAALLILRKSLGEDAVNAADTNLQDLLATEDDETDDDQEDVDGGQTPAQSVRRDSIAKWDQESVWKRSRLRVMMRSELSDLEIDDDERYAKEIVDPEKRSSQAPVKLGLSVELFLAGVLDYVGEHFITLAAMLAVSRAHRRSIRTKAPPTSHTLVEEPDVEKAVLNSPLDRTWRSWRKALRSRPYSTASQRLRQLSASSSSSPVIDRRRSSNDLHEATHDDLSLPGSMPGAFVETPGDLRPGPYVQMPDIPETHHPNPLQSHPKGNGHASDPTGSKWATRPSRRQSGPPSKRVSTSANSSSGFKKQRSFSLPVIPPFVPKLKTVEQSSALEEKEQHADADTLPEMTPQKALVSTEDSLNVDDQSARKGSAVSTAHTHSSEMSTPEIVHGYQTDQATAAVRYSAGAAALVRHVSPRESAHKLNEVHDQYNAKTDMSRDNDAASDQEQTVKPKARNREAVVGMEYTKVTILPQESPVFTAKTSERVPPPVRAEEYTGVPAPEPPAPQEPTHISKIRAQRAQSEARQGGMGASGSASSSPKLGLRARATSTGKAEPVRSDSLRRLAAENSNPQVPVIDDDRSRVVGRSPLLGSSNSVHSIDNFDALIAGGETIKLTLSPQSVRDGSVEPVVAKVDPPRTQDRKPLAPPPLTGNDSIIEEEGSPDANGNPKARATFPRPQHLRTKSAGRQSYQAREATVQTDSMQDFADFIRSTGPNNQPQPANITALPNPVKDSSPPSRSGDRSRLGTSNSNTGAKARDSPAMTSRTGLRMPSRFKAKDAKGSDDSGNADLIDFIRNGPNTGAKGGVKYDKSIAPFRTTMDSDELRGLTDKVNSAIAAGSGTPASFQTRPNRASISTTATGQTFSTFNSHAPLVGRGGMVTSSTAPSIVSALGGASPQSENATPRLGRESSPGLDNDGRKRYRNKDIYALPSDDDDDDDVRGAQRSNSKSGKFGQYLTDTNGTGTGTQDKAVAQPSRATGLALNGVHYPQSSSATLGSSSPSTSRPTTGVSSGVPGSRPGSSKPRLEMKSPGSASKVFAKQDMADSSRQTRDLADLFSSAPPPGIGITGSDDEDGAPAPNVGQKAGLDGKDKKSKFWKRKRHADLP